MLPANAKMRAADKCHPLPDQLHPCSRFFRFSSIPSCDDIGAEKIDAFHDAFDRFSGGSCFCARELFVPEAWFPFASPASSPASALRSTFSSGWRRMREGPRSFCSSSREGDASAAIRSGFPECVLELSSIFRKVGFAAVLRKNVAISLAAVSARVPLARCTAALPRRVEPLPT